MSQKQSDAAKSDLGPSWFDVFNQWHDVEAVYESKVTVVVKLARAVNGQMGAYMQASVNGVPVTSIGSGFGRAYGNGPKTMPGALSRLLWAVDDRIAQQRREAALLTQRTIEELWQEAAGGTTD